MVLLGIPEPMANAILRIAGQLDLMGLALIFKLGAMHYDMVVATDDPARRRRSCRASARFSTAMLPQSPRQWRRLSSPLDDGLRRLRGHFGQLPQQSRASAVSSNQETFAEATRSGQDALKDKHSTARLRTRRVNSACPSAPCAARFASCCHESVQNSTCAVKFPHRKPSAESTRFQCITAISWDDFVDSHKTWHYRL